MCKRTQQLPTLLSHCCCLSLVSNLGDALVNGTCQLKWLVSITLNSYYLKVQREIEACRLSSQFSWQRKWIKLLHTRVHNPIPTVCYVTFHFYWEPRPLLRYPPKFTLSVFHTTYFYASSERGYVFFFTFSRLDFSLAEKYRSPPWTTQT